MIPYEKKSIVFVKLESIDDNKFNAITNLKTDP
jgi:hypothetical protein